MMMSSGMGMTSRRARDLADVPMRLALGSAMLYHGLAKLRGEGRQQTGGWFESMGLRPGHFWATATGAAETFAGVAAILGIATRPAALAVIATQAMAATKVHAAKGFDNTKGGMEYNLALISMALGLLAAGAGPLSTSQLARTALARRRQPVKRFSIPGLERFGRRSTLERGLDLIH
jgi:putative oxidoreductase